MCGNGHGITTIIKDATSVMYYKNVFLQLVSYYLSKQIKQQFMMLSCLKIVHNAMEKEVTNPDNCPKCKY